MSAGGKISFSIHGQKLGQSRQGGLVFDTQQPDIVGNRRLPITMSGVKVTGTVSAKVSNVRTIDLTICHQDSTPIGYRANLELYALLDANGADFAVTGGSTGIGGATAGKLLNVVAKKLFKAITDAAGKLTFTVTDTASETFYIGVRLENGNMIVIPQNML